MLKKIFKDAKKYSGYITFGVCCVFVYTALSLASPMFVHELVSLMEKGITADDKQYILTLGLMLLGVYILRVFLRFCSSYFNHKAAWRYVGDLRVRLYDHMQGLSPSFYSDKQTGQLMSRVISDTATFEVLIAHAIPDTITNVITFLGVACLLFYINPLLALLTCIPLPFVALGGIIFAKRLRPNFRRAQRYTGELSADLQDNLSGIKEIQVFNRQDKGISSVKKTSDSFTGAMLGALKMSALFHPSVEFFSSLGTVIVIIGGGFMAVSGVVNAADIVAFTLYLAMFYSPIMTLSRVVEDFQNALAGGERVFEILSEVSSVKDNPNAQRLSDCHGNICFDNVSFSYIPEQQILKNVSFVADGGKMLAIVGPTGAGKTTIISLLMRFYDVSEGKLTIDGTDIRNITLESLRENISIVMQDTFLFNGTIADNIAFAKKDASMDEVIIAAKKARIHDDIMRMPEQYETVVGERGMRLSGGQKQRLSIARAVIRNSPILILDEATASVDIETEKQIQDAIAEISKGRTIIVIAHRLSTIRQADKIIVLEDGKISEEGNHQELTKRNGLYNKLTFLQASSFNQTSYD